MANISRIFSKGVMNKSVDERLIQNGEYVDALNVRINSTEGSNVGSVENAKGNIRLSLLKWAYTDAELSSEAVCVGAYEDGTNNTMYWFVHDPEYSYGATGKMDMIVSYNTYTSALTYHIISMDNGLGTDTTLNFNPAYPMLGIDKIDDFLFFTDNYNQPRKINISRTYGEPDINLIDQFIEDDILVIKRPPANAPEISMSRTENNSSFLTDKFISFAYRYKYVDGEYSAISQFSNPAFTPSFFFTDGNPYGNEGMTNYVDTVNVLYNSGGERVVGIDLLFKEHNSNVIKVIEKIDKESLGLLDNTQYSFEFVNSKIYTILPDYELLRLYDNVPITAKSQTILGKRLIYGNYSDGYDMLDGQSPTKQPVVLSYYPEIESEIIASTDESDTTFTNVQQYTLNGETDISTRTISQCTVEIDFTNVDLTNGTFIDFDIYYIMRGIYWWDGSSGTASLPLDTSEYRIRKSMTINGEYASLTDFVNSNEFREVFLGSDTSMVQSIENANTGNTLTDNFYAQRIQSILYSGNTYNIYEGGILNVHEAMDVWVVGNLVKIQLPAVAWQYVGVGAPKYITAYYGFTAATVSSNKYNGRESLHSNRGYQVGIVYMDDFSRASTVLVSDTNTINIPCVDSDKKNSLKITIPTSQKPPYWATKYKFAIKSDMDVSETIYSDMCYDHPTEQEHYFLLKGDNPKKVSEGDILIVKRDFVGVLSQPILVEVLEKVVFASNELASVAGSGTLDSPSGVYIKINTGKFNVSIGADANYIFESYGAESLPDVYYESSQSFDIVNGYHNSGTSAGDVNQTALVDAVIHTNFFNCYSFGNGAESFRIKDSLSGKSVAMGNRVMSVSSQDYKRAYRYADLTYSGVYNDESNVNKLNEFNLGLANYKHLEDSFGSVEKIVGRQTDVLVLQTDKISYVLVGKNLLSDSVGGGTISSVPEVLGTQIARFEDYGISNDAESFASWGASKYFTDSKRGVVLQLTGTAYSNEQLSVISDLGLKYWFRDFFYANRNERKIGGYDPYMNEYVLFAKDTTLAFSESSNGWVSFYSYHPEDMLGMNQRFYSFKDGNLWIHNNDSVARNNFYDTQYTSKISGIFNDSPFESKVFKTITLEADDKWAVSLQTDMYGDGIINEDWFKNKEGAFFAYIRNNHFTPAAEYQLHERSMRGIGVVVSKSPAPVTGIYFIFASGVDSVSVGDALYMCTPTGSTVDGNPTYNQPQYVGAVSDVSGSTGLQVDNNVIPIGNIPVGSFFMAIKDQIAESNGMLGRYCKFQLENDNTAPTELFAIRTEVIKSYP